MSDATSTSASAPVAAPTSISNAPVAAPTITDRKYYDDVYGQIKAMVVARTFNQAAVMSLISKAMVIVSKFSDLSGMEKKDLVVAVITEVVHDVLEDTSISGGLSEDNRSMILAVVEMAPTIIDQTIGVGKAIYEKRKTEGKGCFCF